MSGIAPPQAKQILSTILAQAWSEMKLKKRIKGQDHQEIKKSFLESLISNEKSGLLCMTQLLRKNRWTTNTWSGFLSLVKRLVQEAAAVQDCPVFLRNLVDAEEISAKAKEEQKMEKYKAEKNKRAFLETVAEGIELSEDLSEPQKRQRLNNFDFTRIIDEEVALTNSVSEGTQVAGMFLKSPDEQISLDTPDTLAWVRI